MYDPYTVHVQTVMVTAATLCVNVLTVTVEITSFRVNSLTITVAMLCINLLTITVNAQC